MSPVKVLPEAGMNQPKLFGKRVRTIRKAARITQERAAEKAGLNAKYVGQIERGEKRPSFDAIVALAKALDISPASFFHFDKEESDAKVLHKKIEILLRDCTPHELQHAYKVLQALLEP
jgi:transcriptional regulator with XRE-family HTH domain